MTVTPPSEPAPWTAADHRWLNEPLRLDRLYRSERAFRFELTRRGLFSELNLLTNAVAFSLLEGAHIFVDWTRMHIDWEALFDTRFAPDGDPALATYRDVEIISIKKPSRAVFDGMRNGIWRMIAEGAVVRVEALGFEGTIEALNGLVAQRLFRPSAAVIAQSEMARDRLGLANEPYVALQLRGGDKTAGVVNTKGLLTIEGDTVDDAVYAARIAEAGAKAKVILVITDDHDAFERFAAAMPAHRCVTNCPPELRGYFHEDRMGLDRASQTRDAARMIADVKLAAEAELFLGPYRSNPSTFTHLLRDGRASVSVDRQQVWAPL
ncbi:MAG: hypothetical protein J0I28_04495 [Caulobacterales bacterium]|nr:hypothetical protein [Caulobacterales bacterium]